MVKRNKRNELVFLDDILESIEKIEEYIDGLTEEEFEKNSEKQDSVIRRIQILGEAVKNILLKQEVNIQIFHGGI